MYNITFLIVVMVIITVCDLLITLLEGVEVYRFNKCTKVLLIFSDEVWFACWPCSCLFEMDVVSYLPNYTASNNGDCKLDNALLTSHLVVSYGMSQEECARLLEGVPYVKVYRYNPKHLCPKLKGYGDKGARKVWSSCGSMYCTWFA